MPRSRKSNRGDGRFEIQRTVGYDADGNRITKSFYGTSKDDAEAKYRAHLAEMERRRAEQQHMLFSAWVDKWLYTYKEPDVKPTSFITTYQRPCKNYILPHFKDKILQEITQVDIKQFLNKQTDLSQSMIDKLMICLKGIFESAIDNDLITKNPCRNISCKSKRQKEAKRTYDKESTDWLCTADHPYGLYVHILLRMGLRCSELCGLRWEDIDFTQGMLSINQALTTENGVIYIGPPKSANSIRKLQIPEDLLERLQKYKGKGYILMNGDHHITPNCFGHRQIVVFYNALKVPKEQRLSPHELRHTCGTLLYEQTKDIYFVSRFLGHSDIGITTKTYVHSEMQQSKVHIKQVPST